MPSYKLREIDLGRPLTPIERAADDEADRIIDQKDASHAMWQAELSDRAKRRWGIGVGK